MIVKMLIEQIEDLLILNTGSGLSQEEADKLEELPVKDLEERLNILKLSSLPDLDGIY